MDEIQVDLVSKLIDVIKNNKKHANYDRVVELRKLYKALITGVDVDDLYKKYIVTDDQKRIDKIKQVVNLLVKPICHKLISLYDEIPRASNQRKVISYTGDNNKTKVAGLEVYLNKFWGVKDLDNYFSHRVIKLLNIDPNSWVVIEFAEALAGKKPSPYPYEVNSENAIYYEKINQVVQNLIVVDGNDYTIYGQNATVVFKNTEDIKPNSVTIKDNEPFIIGGFEYVKINTKFYQIFRPAAHNIGYVPAFQPGYILDNYTEGTSFVNCIDPAIPFILKTIKTTVELDLTMSTSAFPHRLQYDKSCPAIGCNSGKTADGHDCPTCKGTGTWISKTTFDVTSFPLPRPEDYDKIPDLSKMIYWSSPDGGIIKLQIDYIDKCYRDAVEIIYNSDTFTKQQIAQTATGVNLDKQNIITVLHPCAVEYANKYVFVVETIAKIVDMQTDLIVSYVFSKDWQLYTRSDLIAIYQLQKTAGLNEEILDKTEREIIKMDLAGDEQQYLKYSIKKDFAPFGDKTDADILVIIAASNLTTPYQKVLWANWDNIWDELELENRTQNIYILPKPDLDKLLKDKVAKLITEISNSQPKTVPFNALGNGG